MGAGLILLGRIVIEFLFISIIARLGKQWLYGSILVNLLLIAILGAKTITIFGFLTNSGNAFYAGVVYAIYLLIEFHGKEAALKMIFPSVTFVGFFILMLELIVGLMGSPESRAFDEAARVLLSTLPRIGVASGLAFVASQYVNIEFYDALRRRTAGTKLWLRNILSVTVTQAIDSTLFFSIAFATIAPRGAFMEIMLTGFVAKVIVGIMSTPFLYLSLLLRKE